jgi:hypothetical protein
MITGIAIAGTAMVLLEIVGLFVGPHGELGRERWATSRSLDLAPGGPEGCRFRRPSPHRQSRDLGVLT